MGNTSSKKSSRAKTIEPQDVSAATTHPQSGYSFSLEADERINNLDSQAISRSMLHTKMPFIGSINGDEASSMGCLLRDGTFLTTLHSVYNLPASRYYDHENMLISFVKGRDVYQYKIKEIVHDGTAAIQQYGTSAITYDYALLRLEGDPLKDLGGGLVLDAEEHFSQPFVTDPIKTVAISGPIFNQVAPGKYNSFRYVSLSKNEAAFGQNYSFSQMGTHPAVPGMSGQMIFPFIPHDSLTVYAVHVGYDPSPGMRFGFKASEYLATLGVLTAASMSLEDSAQASSPVPFLDIITREANKKSQKRKKEKEAGKAINAAVERTEKRLEKYPDAQYEVMSARDLATHFPQLGLGIFNVTKATTHTQTNKTLFQNKTTGWYVCYDAHGDYNTVHNEYNHYVALDGSTDPTGKDSKFHFYNNVPSEDFEMGR